MFFLFPKLKPLYKFAMIVAIFVESFSLSVAFFRVADLGTIS